jgi:pre-mRNA-splicing factor ATP-dependent RNA helicase DHX15/PRP43
MSDSYKITDILKNPKEILYDDSISASSNYTKMLKDKIALLPVYAKLDEFQKEYNEKDVIIIKAGTGSGKTSQIPKCVLLMECIRQQRKGGIFRPVVCTQPRKIPSSEVTRRTREELDLDITDDDEKLIVGYVNKDFKFGKEGPSGKRESSDDSMLMFVTEGILVNEIMSPKKNILEKYSCIIIDEAHERNLDTDLILLYLAERYSTAFENKTPIDFKIIIMSATVNAEQFKSRFPGPGTNIFPVPGQSKKVSLIYSAKNNISDYINAAIQITVDIHTRIPSIEDHILIFLSSTSEIDVCKKRIESMNISGLVPLPLHANLSEYDKLLAIKEGGIGRKVIISTNAAETSITIENLVYVIDTGLSKQDVYDSASRVNSLYITPISKSSADQRKGRVGRVKDGTCYRLYTEDTYRQMIDYSEPSIMSSNLSGFVFKIVNMKISPCNDYYISKPSLISLSRSAEVLYYLGFIDENGAVTPDGIVAKEMDYPFEISRMLINSKTKGCLKEIAIIAAFLMSSLEIFDVSDKDIVLLQKVYGPSKHDVMTGIRKQYADPRGDHLTFLNIFSKFLEISELIVSEDNKKAECKKHYLKYDTLVLVRETYKDIIYGLGYKKAPNSSAGYTVHDYYNNILETIFSGFFMNLAYMNTDNYYSTLKENNIASLDTSSVLLEGAPNWVTYDNITLTDKNYMKIVSKVEQDWICSNEKCKEFYEDNIKELGLIT